MKHSFVIAENRVQAIAALQRAGWTRLGRDIWTKGTERVGYLLSPDHMRGYRDGKLYLAHKFYERPDWGAVQDVAKSLGFEVSKL